MKEKFTPNHLHLLIKGHLNKSQISEEYLNNFFINLIEKGRAKLLECNAPGAIRTHGPRIRNSGHIVKLSESR